MNTEYEMIIGLEVHIELKTETKIFCSCPTGFGAEPNTQCYPVCAGLPGALPVLNKKVVEYAVKAGLATHCQIARLSRQDRKNYFYPDLPKAYQISQYDLPLCEHGYLTIETASGPKQVGITRIHIEGDAGKLVHDEQKGTFIDLNRCGVPLIEVVSEPDMRSAEEARAYLQKLRTVILSTGISDCRMNEGSLRCDVNLSIRPVGETRLGTRTEIKNLNSFQSMVRAIEYEFARQVEAVRTGQSIVQETRRFDQASGKTYSMRGKEEANDYRYFPDPDLPPIALGSEEIEALRATLPASPDARERQYVKEYGLSAADARRIAADAGLAEYFEQGAKSCAHPRIMANLLISEALPLSGTEPIRVKAGDLAQLADMLAAEEINSSTAKRVLREISQDGQPPRQVVDRLGLWQINDERALGEIVRQVLEESTALVESYRRGKQAALKGLIGQAMAKSNGLGNPVKIETLLRETLK